MNHRWITAQIGAREHYAIAVGLHKRQCLDRLYTDIWCRYGARTISAWGGKARDLAGRFTHEIPNSRVTSFTISALWHELLRPRHESRTARYARYIREGEWFSTRVASHILRNENRSAQAYFGYTTGARETLAALQSTGIPTVVAQIDAGRIHEQVVQEESQRWPGWQSVADPIGDDYFQRLEDEWRLANVVVVNSAWSRDALLRQGVNGKKIIIVPVAFDPSRYEAVAAQRTAVPNRALRVLWLGNVNLAKGIHYLMQAVRKLPPNLCEIRVIGGIGISPEEVARAPHNMRFEGRLPRLETTHAYAWADVFVFPTLSDGFGITQLEAMAHGLPVISTTNCGAVVTHGSDGFVVPPADADAIAISLQTLAADRDLVAAMSHQALVTAKRFSVDVVVGNLISQVDRVLADRAKPSESASNTTQPSRGS